MTELAYLATRNIGQFHEQRRNKLQDAVSGIPPADQQQEICCCSGVGQGTAPRTQVQDR
jgi:hypothetical protein